MAHENIKDLVHGKSACAQAICWPVIIYAVFVLITLVTILFSSGLDSNTKAWSFFVTLLWGLIWGAILWFFCRSGNHAIAWFLLLLPLAIGIFWFFSYFLARATAPEQCVAYGATTDMSLHMF